MDWTDQELRDLATFLARRMTVDLEVLDPTDPPPSGDPIQAWMDTLTSAREKDGLNSLSRKMAKAAPADENLQQACTLLANTSGRNTMQVMGAAISVGVFALVAGGLYVSSVVSSTAAPAPESALVMATDDEPRPAPLTAIPEPEGLDEEPAKEVVVDLPPASKTPAMVVAQTEPVNVAPATLAPQAVVPDCQASPGTVIGYWYAGEVPPGALGVDVSYRMPSTCACRTLMPTMATTHARRWPAYSSKAIQSPSSTLPCGSQVAPGGCRWWRALSTVLAADHRTPPVTRLP